MKSRKLIDSLIFTGWHAVLIIEVNLGLNHRQNRRGKDQRIITVLLLTEMGFIFFFFLVLARVHSTLILSYKVNVAISQPSGTLPSGTTRNA